MIVLKGTLFTNQTSVSNQCSIWLYIFLSTRCNCM